MESLVWGSHASLQGGRLQRGQGWVPWEVLSSAPCVPILFLVMRGGWTHRSHLHPVCLLWGSISYKGSAS